MPTGKHPSVSVIVPTHNNGHFIGEAIESILRQTHPPEQIIIVDDGSTDDTEQVVRRWMQAINSSEPRIEYLKCLKNEGVSAARNLGLAAARCDLVAFLDADDRWRPTYIDRMRGFLIGNPDAVCAISNFVRFQHETAQWLGDQFHLYPELRRDLPDDVPTSTVRRYRKDHAFSALVAFGEIPAFTVVMMFRRKLIAGLRFDTQLKVCEDTHFALRAFMRGDVILTSEVLCEVRRHGANATRDYHMIALHKLQALKALTPFIAGAGRIAAYRDRLVKAHIDASLHLVRSGRVRDGLRHYVDGLLVPSSPLRKLKGSVRMAFTLPRGLAT